MSVVQHTYEAVDRVLLAPRIMAIPTLVAFLASRRRHVRRRWTRWPIGVRLTAFILADRS